MEMVMEMVTEMVTEAATATAGEWATTMATAATATKDMVMGRVDTTATRAMATAGNEPPFHPMTTVPEGDSSEQTSKSLNSDDL